MKHSQKIFLPKTSSSSSNGSLHKHSKVPRVFSLLRTDALWVVKSHYVTFNIQSYCLIFITWLSTSNHIVWFQSRGNALLWHFYIRLAPVGCKFLEFPLLMMPTLLIKSISIKLKCNFVKLIILQWQLNAKFKLDF